MVGGAGGQPGHGGRAGSGGAVAGDEQVDGAVLQRGGVDAGGAAGLQGGGHVGGGEVAQPHRLGDVGDQLRARLGGGEQAIAGRNPPAVGERPVQVVGDVVAGVAVEVAQQPLQRSGQRRCGGDDVAGVAVPGDLDDGPVRGGQPVQRLVGVQAAAPARGRVAGSTRPPLTRIGGEWSNGGPATSEKVTRSVRSRTAKPRFSDTFGPQMELWLWRHRDRQLLVVDSAETVSDLDGELCSPRRRRRASYFR
jgi:hypothetical protein